MQQAVHHGQHVQCAQNPKPHTGLLEARTCLSLHSAVIMGQPVMQSLTSHKQTAECKLDMDCAPCSVDGEVVPSS